MSEKTKKLNIITDIFTLFEPKEKYDYIKVHLARPAEAQAREQVRAGRRPRQEDTALGLRRFSLSRKMPKSKLDKRSKDMTKRLLPKVP